MKTHTPFWTATSTSWKEASRSPRKPVVFGIFVVMILAASVVALKAQAVAIAPQATQHAAMPMLVHARTIPAARNSLMETLSLLLDLARKNSHKTIS